MNRRIGATLAVAATLAGRVAAQTTGYHLDVSAIGGAGSVMSAQGWQAQTSATGFGAKASGGGFSVESGFRPRQTAAPDPTPIGGRRTTPPFPPPHFHLALTALPDGGAVVGSMDMNAAQVIVAPHSGGLAALDFASEDTSDLTQEAAKRRSESSARIARVGAAVDLALQNAPATQGASAPSTPLQLRLGFDPAAVPAGGVVGLFYWDSTAGRWQLVGGSTVDATQGIVTASVPASGHRTYSVYSVAALNANGALQFGDVFAFPNPATGARSTIHVETVALDELEIRIYDFRGGLVHRDSINGTPTIGVNGKQAFEYAWDVSSVASGGYMYVIEARRSGETGRVLGKLAVRH